MTAHPTLISLQELVATRVSETLATRADWPCRRGCDACCRSLAALPEATEPEWQLLEQHLQTLPEETRNELLKRVAEAVETPQTPVICPFLNGSEGACSVYPARFLACRTYGFYLERDRGLYCSDLERSVAAGRMDYVVWGNAEAFQDASKALGTAISMRDWFQSFSSR